MSQKKINESSIGIDVTKNVNLLKKYHKSLVFDYTEYEKVIGQNRLMKLIILKA